MTVLAVVMIAVLMLASVVCACVTVIRLREIMLLRRDVLAIWKSADVSISIRKDEQMEFTTQLARRLRESIDDPVPGPGDERA